MKRDLMPLLQEVSRKSHLNPAFIFKCAMDYNGECHNIPREIQLELFKACKRGEYFSAIVEDFCLDVLNGTVKLPNINERRKP